MKTLKHIRKITQGKKTQQQQERESLLFETKWDFFFNKAARTVNYSGVKGDFFAVLKISPQSFLLFKVTHSTPNKNPK